MLKAIFILAFCLSFALSETIDSVYEKCGTNVKCAEKKVINIIDDYDNKARINLFGGLVTIEKNEEEAEIQKSEDVIDRFVRYLSSHELKFKFPSADARNFISGVAGRSSKLKKLILPALLLLKLKAWVLIPAALSAIALVAFKGLGAGAVALLLAIATAFRGTIEPHRRVSLEVVPPHWSRAGLAPSGPATAYVPEYVYQTLP